MNNISSGINWSLSLERATCQLDGLGQAVELFELSFLICKLKVKIIPSLGCKD